MAKKTYILRDEKGTMRAKISNRLAGVLIAEFDGKWVEKNLVRTGKVLVYVFEGNYRVGEVDKTEIELSIWNGDYLIQESI
jgi:hypothetical protein